MQGSRFQCSPGSSSVACSICVVAIVLTRSTQARSLRPNQGAFTGDFHYPEKEDVAYKTTACGHFALHKASVCFLRAVTICEFFSLR